MIEDDEQRQLERLQAQLLDEYGPVVGPEVVTERLSAVVADFADAPVRAFVPLLANRMARRELQGAASR